MKKKSFNLFFGLLMMVALLGSLILVKKNQDSRRGAYFAGTKLLLQSQEISANVGDQVPVQFWLETDGEAKVSSADVTVCYDTNLNLDSNELDKKIILNEEVLQDLIVTEMPSHLDVVGAKQCLRVVAIASPKIKPENLKSGMIKLLTINFTAFIEGSGEILILKDNAKIGGYNPQAGATDTALKVGTVTGSTFTITPGGSNICETDEDCPSGFECYQPPMPPCSSDACTQEMPPKYCRPIQGQWPVLNYKIEYIFVKSDNSKCFVPKDWPLQIKVEGINESKIYNNVVPQAVDDSGIFITLKGSLVLEDFNEVENIAVYMKGPKHLQMKYAVDKQKTRYGKAGGELILTKSVETSPVYDFTAYPILSGDVVGKNSDNPDGIVDGYDWTEVKKWAKVLKTVDDGGYIESDLDGSCQVNSNDLYQLRKTLEEKQGELY